MYLSGSKWNMRKKRKRPNLFRIAVLLALILGVVYIWQFYVPSIPPLFVPTPTASRSPASFVLEAESLFQSGKLEQAEKSYQQAISVDPREPAHYVQLARVRMFEAKYADAETAARDALVLDPENALALGVLAWTLDFQASDEPDLEKSAALLAEALQSIEKALGLNPGSALLHAYYAEILMDNDINDYERASEAARTAISIDNSSLEAHRAMGYVWELTGNRDLALESYTAASRINPFLPGLHIDIGNMLRSLGDVDRAIESYLTAVSLSPTNTEPLILIANAYAGDGQFGNASQYARQAVELDPSNPRLRGNLGRMYYHNNVLDEALVQLNLAIRGGQSPEGVFVEGLPLDDPVPDPRVVEFYYTYGLALAKTGICEGAIEIFEYILLTVPEDEVAVFNAEEGLYLCGQIERTPTPEGGTEGSS
jgi:tetratricopeptide (TPR) repeat protein